MADTTEAPIAMTGLTVRIPSATDSRFNETCDRLGIIKYVGVEIALDHFSSMNSTQQGKLVADRKDAIERREAVKARACGD